MTDAKTFYRQGKLGSISYATVKTIAAVLFLNMAITNWNTPLGNRWSWQNQWWVCAIAFILFGIESFLSWRGLFSWVRVCDDGIWFYRLGKTRQVLWEEIDRIGAVRSRGDGNSEFGVVLRKIPGPVEEDKTLFGLTRRPADDLLLSPYARDWSVSKLRAEIKRRRPSLSVG
jgi:hypothetical protein